MPSPEHKLQPSIVFAPDHKTGRSIPGSPLEALQQSPLIEDAPIPEKYLEAVKLHSSAALGFMPKPAPPGLESNQSSPSGQSVTIGAEQIRAIRRERFEQTGYVPPIAGGAPKRIDLPIDDIVALYRDQHISAAEIAQQFGVSPNTIYKRLHELAELDLTGTRIGDKASKQMEEESDDGYKRWLVENQAALQKEKEEIREEIRNTLGEEFLKQSEETERAIKDLIEQRKKRG